MIQSNGVRDTNQGDEETSCEDAAVGRERGSLNAALLRDNTEGYHVVLKHQSRSEVFTVVLRVLTDRRREGEVAVQYMT
ncbi:Hypothetical protein SMAX5B_003093 [Scophthalmus maximus]|uniref:Uncharacterized protein n=1 Tax=Scophthalmus maximus TaxID=52904 RepID=A0A2U9BN82_SCOMX|nr:Hypothetical protein SMAX5B_003093 [Scophthalmus maximus]